MKLSRQIAPHAFMAACQIMARRRQPVKADIEVGSCTWLTAPVLDRLAVPRELLLFWRECTISYRLK